MITFPNGSRGTESACQSRRCRRPGFNPWFRKIPWRMKEQHTPVLPGQFYEQRSLAGYSSWGHKESDVTEQLTLNTGLADNPPLERNDSAQKRSKIEGRFSTYL